MGQQASCRDSGATAAPFSDMHKETRQVNVLLLGDTCVGKTSLVQRFCSDTFQSSIVTIGIDSRSRDVQVNGERLKAHVVDTPGLERFQAATFRYYPLAACVAVTYSVTDRASFEHVKKWVRDVEIHGDRQACHMLIANKADLEEDRTVSVDEGRALARNLGLNFFETSAKTAQNVEAVFASMAMTAQLRILELQDVARASRTQAPHDIAGSYAGRGRQSVQSRNGVPARNKSRCGVLPVSGLSSRLSALP